MENWPELWKRGIMAATWEWEDGVIPFPDPGEGVKSMSWDRLRRWTVADEYRDRPAYPPTAAGWERFLAESSNLSRTAQVNLARRWFGRVLPKDQPAKE